MTETPKKNNRRRRRPRRQSKPKNKAAQATEQSADNTPAKASSENRRNRRSGRRRKPNRGKQKAARGNSELVYQQHNQADLDVSPINKDIFIYTYTLRPQSLLDNYQVGPGVVENMEFENQDSSGDLIG